VLAIIWVTLVGWREYSVHWWWMSPVVHSGGECWDRLAKWPDGKPFDQWDTFSDEAPPGSFNERDRWRESVREKLRACEEASPLMERLIGWVAENFSSVKDSLLFVLLPPFGVLLFGYCVGWVAKGFRPVQ
jgi:hypothetical protein